MTSRVSSHSFMYRWRPFLVPLLIILVTALAVIAAGGVVSSLSLAIVFAGVVATIAVERQAVSPTPDTEAATL